MKSAIKFIKTTVIGGVVVIIPIAVIIVVLGDAYQKLIAVTKPLTESMIFGPFINAVIATLIVILLIVVIFFIAGLLINTLWGKNAKNWLEKNVFERIPMYSTLSELTQRVAGIENSNFPVVEVDLYGNANRVLGVVTESLPDGRLMVYIPYSPIVTVGQLIIVSKDSITELDASITSAINCLSKMGLEAEKIYPKPDCNYSAHL